MKCMAMVLRMFQRCVVQSWLATLRQGLKDVTPDFRNSAYSIRFNAGKYTQNDLLVFFTWSSLLAGSWFDGVLMSGMGRCPFLRVYSLLLAHRLSHLAGSHHLHHHSICSSNRSATSPECWIWVRVWVNPIRCVYRAIGISPICPMRRITVICRSWEGCKHHHQTSNCKISRFHGLISLVDES